MDPYGLFVIVLNDLFIQGDGILWKLAAVFRHMELVGGSVFPSLMTMGSLIHPKVHTSKSAGSPGFCRPPQRGQTYHIPQGRLSSNARNAHCNADGTWTVLASNDKRESISESRGQGDTCCARAPKRTVSIFISAHYEYGRENAECD
jgi:hypothetical protein